MKRIAAQLSTLVLVLLLLVGCTGGGNFGPKAYLGNENAPILIEEFSDLQCPACAAISPQVEKLVRNNPDLARFVYYHFPLPQHPFAFKAAEASECAADQGKFYEYLDLAFENQKDLTEDNLKKLAGVLNLDQPTFDSCLDNGDKRAQVKSELFDGRARQVNSTPTLFVNGQKVQWTDAETFEAYLRSL